MKHLTPYIFISLILGLLWFAIDQEARNKPPKEDMSRDVIPKVTDDFQTILE